MRREGVEVWSSGALEACCRCRNVEEAEVYGGLEMRRRRVDVEVFASRARELWRCAAGVASLSQEIWSSGGMLRAWGRGGVMQAWGRCLKERWRRAAGVGTCRTHRGMESWICAAGA